MGKGSADKTPAPSTDSGEQTQDTASGEEQVQGGASFTSEGTKPPVLKGHKAGPRKPTASERAYGGHGAAAKHDSITPSLDEPAVPRGEAEPTVIAAADIIQHERRQQITNAPARFHHALELLYSAATGRKGNDTMHGEEQVNTLDAAMIELEPAIAVFRHDHEDAVWLDDQLMKQVTWKRSSARFQRGMDRVNNSIQIDGKAVEMPGNDEPRKQGMLLHQQIHKLAPQMGEINEQFLRMSHGAIDKEIEKLLEGEEKQVGKKLTPGSLVQLQAALWLADGFLTLSDEEFQHELGHIQGVFNGVATYSELVKAITELLGGTLVTTASFAGVLAKLAGDATSAGLCMGVARQTGLVFANVIAGVEIIHGVFVLLDPHASKEKKMDAAAGVASGSAWFIGLKVGGAAMGFAASTAIMLGYAELKLVAHLYWQSSLGLTTGLMRMSFETIQRDGQSIAMAAENVAKVKDLMASETDPEKAADLKRVHDVLVQRLADALDYFIDDCAPRGFEAGIAHYPGAWPVFLELFGPLKKFKGAKDEATAVAGATEALGKITWAMAHAGDLAVTSARNKHLGDLEKDLEKKEQGHAEE